MTASDLHVRRPPRTLHWIAGICVAGAAIAYAIVYVFGGTVSRPSWLFLAAGGLAVAASLLAPTRPTAHRNLIVVAGLLSAAGLVDVLVMLVRRGGL